MKRYCLAIAALIGASSATADTVALTSSRTAGNQIHTGGLGTDFNVLTPILITQLGAFDSGGTGFIGTVQVGIFNRSTQSLVAPSVSLTGSSATLVGSSRFVDVPDFVLPVGNYSIVTVGYSATEQNGNSFFGGSAPTPDTGGGVISFVGVSRWSNSTSLLFPTGLDTLPIQYDAGTFQFTSTVPELATSTLTLVGLASLLVFTMTRRNMAA